MAQSGFTPIQIYYSTTTTNAPTAGNLVDGELAINTADGKLFYKDNLGAVQVIATKGSGTIGGSNTQVQYNNGGALAGSSNLTFNGTTLTANDIIDSSLTASKPVFTNGSKNLVSTGIMPTDQGGTGVANGANNTITFTGNFSLGLTLTGNTSVTLPTSGAVATKGNAIAFSIVFGL